MEKPRPEKVAVVDEVRAKLEASEAAVLTEYRGLNVSATAELRRALREAGGTRIDVPAPAQIALMRKAVEPVHVGLARRIGTAWLDDARKAIDGG